MAFEILFFAEEIPDALSACRWLIFISSLYFFLSSLECCAIFCSVVLSYGSGSLLAYCHSEVFRSARVQNFATSLLHTITSGSPGSLRAVVLGYGRTTVLLGAKVPQRPRKSPFDRLETFLANFNCCSFPYGVLDLSNLGVG